MLNDLACVWRGRSVEHGAANALGGHSHRHQRQPRSVRAPVKVPLLVAKGATQVLQVVGADDAVVLRQVITGPAHEVSASSKQLALVCPARGRGIKHACPLAHHFRTKGRFREPDAALVVEDHVSIGAQRVHGAVDDEARRAGHCRVPGSPREIHHRIGPWSGTETLEYGDGKPEAATVGQRTVLRHGHVSAAHLFQDLWPRP